MIDMRQLFNLRSIISKKLKLRFEMLDLRYEKPSNLKSDI